MEKIDYNINGQSTISQAARRLRYVPMAYQRFLMMPLYWVGEGVGAYGATDGRYGATDGRSIFVNPRGKQKIEHTSDPVGYFAFFLLHEVLHALLNHALRLLKLENHQRANEAADYVINAIIQATNEKVEREHGFTPFPMIDGVLYDPNISHRKDSNGEPKGKPYSAEEVYQNLGIQELMDQKNQEPEPSEGDGGDGESDGSVSGDSANDDSENDDSDDGAEANSNVKGKLTVMSKARVTLRSFPISWALVQMILPSPHLRKVRVFRTSRVSLIRSITQSIFKLMLMPIMGYMEQVLQLKLKKLWITKLTWLTLRIC
jgi:hypothetical protein